MIVHPNKLFAALWICWIVSWMAAAAWSSRVEKRATTWEVGAYRALMFVGAILLTNWGARAFGERPIWHVGDDGGYALAGLALAGILFAWWARIHLGRLWSSAITRKKEHHIIDTGPYALVRHPIYTGLIAAVLATAAAMPTATALIGAVLIVCGFWLKARTEERFLMAELGPDAYGPYRRRVPMLVPFLPHGD